MRSYEEIGRSIVRHARAIALLIVELREDLARRRAAGETVDATPVAGWLARELHELGGSLADRNANRLRWPFEEQRPLDDPQGLKAMVALAVTVGEALARRRGTDGYLERIASVWTESLTRASAQEALAALERTELEARGREEAEAHAKRLATKSAERRNPLPRVNGPADPKPAEGEWIVGDDDVSLEDVRVG